MDTSLSVLQNAKNADVNFRPFPHIVIKNALPASLCDELIKSYPSLEALEIEKHKSNMRWSYPAAKTIDNKLIADVWKKFITYHTSSEFFKEVVELFYKSIINLYPSKFSDYEEIKSLNTGIRYLDDFTKSDILLDAQISGNTPVVNPSSVRTTHIDENDKLFSGLYYLRSDNDSSEGGNLTINQLKWSYFGNRKWRCYDGVYVKDKYTKVVKTIKYEKNVLVLFINSLESLHGVTIRQPTSHSRIFLNLVGVVDTPLFNVPSPSKPLTKKMKANFIKRYRKLVSSRYVSSG